MPPNPLANLMLYLFLLSAAYCSTQVLADFTEAPVDLNVTEGDPLSLNCTFTNAERIFWRKEGVEIASGDANFQIIDLVLAADTSMLSLHPSAEHTVHTGVYDCVAVMSGRELSTTFTITIQYLANVSISFRPFQCINEGGGNPYIGSEVIIDCMAEGEPFPQVTWFIMNRNLMDTEDPNVNFQQNNRILFISSLQSNHSGLYFCRSENNLFPFKQSPQVHLGFQVPGTELPTTVMITNTNHNGVIYAAENDHATIDCVVSPPFPSVNNDVTFRRPGTTIISSGDYGILTKPCNCFTLIINHINTIRTGEYSCKVGGKYATVRLQIGTVVPVAVSTSLSTVGVGRNVTFHCSGTRLRVNSDIPQDFVWHYQRQGVEVPVRLIPIEDRVEIDSNTATITSVLTLKRVILSDSGLFSCRTFNHDQPSIQESSGVILNVEDSPSISVTPPTSIVRVGAPLSLICIMATTRNSSFSWEVNGVNVNQLSDEYSVSTILPNQTTLSISRLAFSDLGQIRCIGEDPIHIPVHAEASIIETIEPYIIGQGGAEIDVYFRIQTNLMLNCTVRNTGGETVNIQWFLGNRQLNSGPEFHVDSSDTLIKNNISLSDEAEYLCRAELGTVRVLELTINVMVTIPPTFTKTPPDPSKGVRGERFKLTCEASGRPTPTIFWAKTSQSVIELGDPLIRDLGNGSLIFEQLQSNHSGLYLCEIQGARSLTSQTLLIVVDMKEEESMGVGELNKSESILIFTVVGLVAILILIASVMVTAILLGCYYMHHRPQGGLARVPVALLTVDQDVTNERKLKPVAI